MLASIDVQHHSGDCLCLSEVDDRFGDVLWLHAASEWIAIVYLSERLW